MSWTHTGSRLWQVLLEIVCGTQYKLLDKEGQYGHETGSQIAVGNDLLVL